MQDRTLANRFLVSLKETRRDVCALYMKMCRRIIETNSFSILARHKSRNQPKDISQHHP
jgi:hypothetical protein